MLRAYSYAKINLFLHITSKRSDGYHNIYSLLTKISLFDYLSVEKSEHFSIKSNNEYLSIKDNNILYTLYSKLKGQYNIMPCSIILNKNIPVGAGLGGGSSNVAVFLELLIKMNKLDLSTEVKKDLLASISADAPYFLYNGPRIISGIGDVISDRVTIPGFYILLIKPSFSMSTKDIYQSGRVDITVKPPHFSGGAFSYNDLIRHAHNDLERAIFHVKPYLFELKKLLKKQGADICLVTGSGSAIYGIFSSKKDLLSAHTFFLNNFNDLAIYKLSNIN